MDEEESYKDSYKNNVERLIREGKTYQEVQEFLRGKYGKGIAGKTFGDVRDRLFPDRKIEEGLTKAKERTAKEKVKKEKKEKDTKKAKWSEGNQRTADDSKIAELLNRGLFYAIPCPTKQLKEKDVQDINLGGAIIATFLYYFPDLNLNHPLIILSMRIILLFVAVKKLCFVIKEKIKEVISGKQGVEGVDLH